MSPVDSARHLPVDGSAAGPYMKELRGWGQYSSTCMITGRPSWELDRVPALAILEPIVYASNR